MRRLMMLSAAAALLSSCSPSPQQANEANIIDNGLNAEGKAVEAADDRADHLDEAAQEALLASNRVTGASREALRNQAFADRNEAEAIREQGQVAGAQAEGEAEAGLLNKQ